MRKLFLLSLAVTSLALARGRASGAVIYTYSTVGAFSSLITTGTSASAVTSPTRSTFTFAGTGTETLTFADQSTTTQPGTSTFDLGQLSLTESGLQSSPISGSAAFSLAVDFTAPTSTGTPFQSMISGNLFGTAGGATLTFFPTTVAFTDGNPADDFSLTLNADPVQVSTTTPTVAVTATLTAVPEPASAGILVLGALGLLRRRNRARV